MEGQWQRSGLSVPRPWLGAEQKSVVWVWVARAASGKSEGDPAPHSVHPHPQVNC